LRTDFLAEDRRLADASVTISALAIVIVPVSCR
jgi:hypothetical protein